MALGIAWVSASASAAVDIESLVSPGPLIAAHAREAKECESCHERFERSSQDQLCLACHEEIRGDVDQGLGFHGRIRRDTGSECRICHTEHQGADADIVGRSAESFDHDRTDFVLAGRHQAIPCASCHEAGKPRRAAGDTCVACHEADDPHGGRLGSECESCHEPAGWESVTFDHAATKFPLEGLHAESSCASCHPQQRFAKTPTACVSCHRVDDAHRGRLGAKCADCHAPKGWKETRFDHGRETRFPLTGRHAALACESCHGAAPRSGSEEAKPGRACIDCHRPDDDHRGLRGERCASCHDARAWTPARFDHASDAKLPLRGAHERLACELCHVGEMYVAKAPSECEACHASVDVHEGSLGGDCAACHGEKSWRAPVRFDHDLTRFPLLALHQLATCEDCHVSKRYGEAEDACAACHARADVHEGRLGSECSLCHNPNGWERWLFDHDRQTRFALTGAHRSLACAACHRADARAASSAIPDDLGPNPRCRSCHLRDSPHDGAYGRDCERCHVDTSWDQIERRPE